MARKIFQQPNVLFAEYSTKAGFTIVNASKEEIIKHSFANSKSWGEVVKNILDNPKEDGSFFGISRMKLHEM